MVTPFRVETGAWCVPCAALERDDRTADSEETEPPVMNLRRAERRGR